MKLRSNEAPPVDPVQGPRGCIYGGVRILDAGANLDLVPSIRAL